jgi:hypothetical protein
LSGVLLGCALYFSFIWQTENLFEKSIGQRTFSPFSGWQLAGNALIMYRHISLREEDIPPPEMQRLHKLVLNDLNDMPPQEEYPDDELQIYFTWYTRSPLMKYSQSLWHDDMSTEDLKKWATLGSLYHKYGVFLIKKHPFAFVRYYVGQGISWFIYPKVEITNIFSKGGFEITDRIKNWFGYKSNWISCTTSHLYSIVYFPAIATILNLLFLLGIIGFFYLRCYKTADRIFNKAVLLVGVYWLVNFLFVIVSAPYMLRYALSLMILDLAFVPLLLERIYFSMRKLEN